MAEEHPEFDSQLHAAFDAAYELERELTGGGMSRVFLATERSLNRKVVIKVLPPELAAGVNRERFRREIQLAAQLQHPHIVPLYAAGEHGELLYYTMPFIEGESLKHALHGGRSTRFSPKEVLRVLHDVVDALTYAHERGVIHRDIKPGNVLRSGNHAVVTDFGVAKAISAAMPQVGMTASGMAIGTPAYMAPEQLAGDPAADQRVDIYAVGLLAYELLTGQAPFTAPSPQETMVAQLTRAPAAIEKVRTDVPPELLEIVMACLAKQPEKRPQTAATLLAQLDAIALSSGDYRPVRPTSTTRWVALAGGAAVAVAAFAFAVRDRSASQPADDAKPPATPATAAPATVAVAPTLTHDDSLAIAKAVEAKMAERGTATARSDQAALSRMADSLRVLIEKSVFDSLAKHRPAAPPPGVGGAGGPQFVDANGRILPGVTRGMIDSLVQLGRQGGTNIRANENFGRGNRGEQPLTKEAFEQRAANMGPARRVVITEPNITSRTLQPSQSVALQFSDRLRKLLSKNKRFTIVDRDSVRALAQTVRSINEIAPMLHADVVANVQLYRANGDSVIWQLTARDLSASPAYGVRVWATKPMTQGDRIAGLDTLLARTAKDLEEMDKAPRRRGGFDPNFLPFRPGGGADEPGAPSAAASGTSVRPSAEEKIAQSRRLDAIAKEPPRRVAIWTHPANNQHPEIVAAGTAITDLLRRVLSGNRRFVPIDRDSTVTVLIKSRDRNEVIKQLSPDMMVTIRGNPVGRDSVLWTTTVWDLTAVPSSSQRAIKAGVVSAKSPMVNADSLLRVTLTTMSTLDRTVRK